MHPGARKGHEAARCAGEQGKFWPYHDKLFASAPNWRPEDLKTYAAEVGLKAQAQACFIDILTTRYGDRVKWVRVFS
ncbi:MAG: hypothetical protein HYU46_17510 [Deltaproteobacteria bacterium]|nr:hypothetical protein [Deltaproteobacteria bacterium]MBI2363556.1 hypothetical protein [Deltaproteobacteria bacterium]MBI3065266.1 hypothetical protein [Deltaproteobacteria bacterium]